MTTERPLPAAALTLDLDNLWTYLRLRGDPDWRQYPGFLDLAVPRMITLLKTAGITATVFVIGRDAENTSNRALLEEIVAAGHDIANHSFDHDPAFHTLDRRRLEADFERSEAALASLPGRWKRFFRAPGYALSRTLLEVLEERAYHLDTSLLPSSVSAFAAWWENRTVRNHRDAPPAQARAALARYPNSAFRWNTPGRLPEFPVSVMPWLRVPVHWTYMNFVAERLPPAADLMLATHQRLCRVANLNPLLLLHCTDFIGADDDCAPRFVPGMGLTWQDKRTRLEQSLQAWQRRYRFTGLEQLLQEFDKGRSVRTLSTTKLQA